jgi:hypothetical protein
MSGLTGTRLPSPPSGSPSGQAVAHELVWRDRRHRCLPSPLLRLAPPRFGTRSHRQLKLAFRGEWLRHGKARGPSSPRFASTSSAVRRLLMTVTTRRLPPHGHCHTSASKVRRCSVAQSSLGRFIPFRWNLLLVMLAKEVDLVLEDLARAFGVTSETVRLVRRAFESGGYEAVVAKNSGPRSAWKVTPRVKRKVEAFFAQGLDVPHTTRKLDGLLSANTVRALHREWKTEQEKPVEPPRQGELLPAGQPLVTVEAAPEAAPQPPKTTPPPVATEEAAGTAVKAGGKRSPGHAASAS